jgi:TctA family transporter
MKLKTRLLTTVSTLLVLCSPVMAAPGAREDSSNVLVWAFLGICGLIIFLQMVPVLSMTYGLIKGVFGDKKGSMEDELETATSKYR